ncbi:hypothetical protein Slin15195_G085930 [Septoria linicola]|uniref:Uncharacterized protein n=1 Tax=Septoria linicola TaxID=215465 RepID=A0A9Q9EMA8_9PEZI|nr:hypothetical protein Slin14017_G088520 [Septoria linicola]USW55274.1 hypothetical protein Slin15195_G085930 [Septoria linicola]
MAAEILEKLQASITATSNDQTVPLDRRTFEEAELVLGETLSPEQNLQLVSSLAALVPDLRENPTPAVNLLQRLLNRYSYGDILSFGNIPFTDGLSIQPYMGSYNRLIISILNKATTNAADAASVATMPETVVALVKLWLFTNDTGVAVLAQKLILDLLTIDLEIRTGPDAHVPAGVQALMWKRVFADQDVYRTFFDACSPHADLGRSPNKGQRSIAQARFMEWLPKVADMDWNTVTRSHHPQIENEHKSKGGLLGFATSYMVDTKGDILMYRCLVDFYAQILEETRPRPTELGTSRDSTGLQYLISSGVHESTAAIYLKTTDDPEYAMEAMFLYGPAANYIATYASRYPDHFSASDMPQQAKARLSVVFDQSPAKWAHAESPKHDLHLLASLPRDTLLPSSRGWHSSPLSQLPSKATNPDVLNTLATIFNGPPRDLVLTTGITGTSAEPSPESRKEAAHARALYYHYVANNRRLWHDIANHADTVALKDLALSAINVLTSVITANWSTEFDTPLPSNIATPPSGHLALLAQPALEYSMPYLISPPRTFANLVGGRGDAESSAYKIAAAKYDALSSLESRLKAQVQQTPGEGYEDILATVSKRLSEGLLSREGDIGGRVGTLEL